MAAPATTPLFFPGARAAYTVTDLGGSVSVTGPEGTDTISNVEKLVFSDTTVNLTAFRSARPRRSVRPQRVQLRLDLGRRRRLQRRRPR